MATTLRKIPGQKSASDYLREHRARVAETIRSIAMVKLLITDIDGTIAKDGWRSSYTDFDERNRQAAHDDSNKTFVLLLSSLAKASWVTACVTSRNERWHQLTQKWLMKHEVDYANMYMRANDDYSSAPEFKVQAVKEILDIVKPVTLLLIDSRQDVVAAYRSEGWSALQSCQ